MARRLRRACARATRPRWSQDTSSACPAMYASASPKTPGSCARVCRGSRRRWPNSGMMNSGDYDMRIAFAALLLCALTLAVGCNRGPDDTAITNDVKSKMFSDPDLKKTNIEVAVKDGEVTLTGTVRKGEYQQRAVQLAQS